MKKFPIVAFAILAVFAATMTTTACNKDDDDAVSKCVEDQIAGAYTGNLRDGATVSTTGRITVSKTSCSGITVQITSPINKTYTVNSIQVNASGSYVGVTTSSEQVAISFTSPNISISIGTNFQFEGRKN